MEVELNGFCKRGKRLHFSLTSYNLFSIISRGSKADDCEFNEASAPLRAEAINEAIPTSVTLVIIKGIAILYVSLGREHLFFECTLINISGCNHYHVLRSR